MQLTEMTDTQYQAILTEPTFQTGERLIFIGDGTGRNCIDAQTGPADELGEEAKCQDCNAAAIGLFYVPYPNIRWEKLCLSCSNTAVYSAFKPINS